MLNRATSSTSTESITELQAQLSQFRSSHPPRTKLPQALGRSAAELARSQGLHPDSVGGIVKRMLRRAGYNPESQGGHSLRGLSTAPRSSKPCARRGIAHWSRFGAISVKDNCSGRRLRRSWVSEDVKSSSGDKLFLYPSPEGAVHQQSLSDNA